MKYVWIVMQEIGITINKSGEEKMCTNFTSGIQNMHTTYNSGVQNMHTVYRTLALPL